MIKKLAAYFIILTLTVMAGGCATFSKNADPGRRIAEAATMIETTAEGIMTLYSLGLISEDDVITAQPYVARAAQALESARSHISYDHYSKKWITDPAFDILMDAIFNFMREPMLILEDAKASKRLAVPSMPVAPTETSNNG